MPRIAPDSNDVIVIPLTGSSPYENKGYAGSQADWAPYGFPVITAQGLISIGGASNAIYIPSTYLVNVRNGAGGGSDVLVTPNVSISGWVFMRRNTNYPAEIFNKQYFANGWSSPFLTFGFQTHSSNDGQLDLYITLNGTLQTQLRTPTSYVFPVGRWCHLGGTWDGTTLRMYINGSLAASAPYTGVIDYGIAGTRGLWYVGGIPGSGSNQDSPVIVQDVRVADIARPQSYFANIYYNGFIL